MKVHIVKVRSIREFCEGHANATAAFENWLEKLSTAGWKQPEDFYETFPSVDFLGNGSSRVVFDIGGNNYRMICKYGFGEKRAHLFICWIGTHASYSELCSRNEQYTVWMF